jgi:hypothetical protein
MQEDGEIEEEVVETKESKEEKKPEIIINEEK